MIDLRHEMKRLFEGDGNNPPLGHFVLYQRGSRRVHCTCWNPRQHEPKPHCPGCNGQGFIYAFERVKAFHIKATQMETYPNMVRVSDPGRVWPAAERLFFQHHVMPQVGDRVFEVGWRGKVPVQLHRVMEINHVEPMRGDNGRVEFHWAAVKNQPVDLPFQSFVLRTYGGQTLYVPRFSPQGEGL